MSFYGDKFSKYCVVKVLGIRCVVEIVMCYSVCVCWEWRVVVREANSLT